jgi:hypothetical protein
LPWDAQTQLVKGYHLASCCKDPTTKWGRPWH